MVFGLHSSKPMKKSTYIAALVGLYGLLGALGLVLYLIAY